MKIEDRDITFVVQGPVQASNIREQIEGITAQCLASIRQYFPESKIVLSTWKNQDLSGLDCDQVIELDDPGPNTIYQDGEPLTLNNNRQIYSSHMGLKAVQTQYAVKLRTDNKLTGRGFVELYQQYTQVQRNKDFQLLNSRVVTSSTFFITSHAGKPVYFHKSDLFDFGEAQDLLKIWNGEFIPEIDFHKKPGYKSRYPATEQVLCLGWISQLLGKNYHINTKANDDAGLGKNFWQECIANNLIVDKPENIGLDVTERFYKRGNLSLEFDLADWKYIAGLDRKPFDAKHIKRKFKNFQSKIVRSLSIGCYKK